MLILKDGYKENISYLHTLVSLTSLGFIFSQIKLGNCFGSHKILTAFVAFKVNWFFMPIMWHSKQSPQRNYGDLAEAHREGKDLLCLAVQDLIVTIKVSTFQQENRGPGGRSWSQDHKASTQHQLQLPELSFFYFLFSVCFPIGAVISAFIAVPKKDQLDHLDYEVDCSRSRLANITQLSYCRVICIISPPWSTLNRLFQDLQSYESSPQ